MAIADLNLVRQFRRAVINITSKEGQPATLGTDGGTIFYNDGSSDHADRVWVRMGADEQVLVIARAPKTGLPSVAGLEVTVVERHGYMEIVDWNRNDSPSHAHDFPTLNVSVGETVGTGGSDTIRIGNNAGPTVTIGGRSIYIGNNTGTAVTTQSLNVIIGDDAGENALVGSGVLVGGLAGESCISLESVYIGVEAGRYMDGEQNVVVGSRALRDSGVPDGSFNIIIGSYACSDTAGTIEENTIIGNEAAVNKTAGDGNTFVGAFSGYDSGASNYNTALGEFAGRYHTGDYCVFLGESSGESSADTNDYRLYINAGAQGTPLIYGEFDDANIGFSTKDMASGTGVIAIANASVVPSGTPTGGGVLYVESGALKYKGSSGTVTTLGVA